MALNEPVESQSGWLTIANKLDNVPRGTPQNPQAFSGFFAGYWTFLVQEGSHNNLIPVGYIADWLVKKINWNRHARFTIYQEGRIIILDAKHGNAQPPDADIEASRSLHAVIMELLFNGGVLGFRHLHHKGDRYRIPGLQGHIEIDRNAAQLFGLMTMAAHMTCHTWETSNEGQQLKLWVSRRAFDKQCDAGKLDDTISEGIIKGNTPLETILAEAAEEANLSRDFVAKSVKATGTLSYFNRCSADEGGHMRPRVLFNFEMELPKDMRPQPYGGKVSEFLRMDALEVKEAIKAGEMTDDAAIVWLGFLVRQGIVDAQNEPDLQQITDRMHRHLPFPIGLA